MQRGRQAQKQQPYAHLQLQRTAAGLALLRSRAAEPGHGSGVTCSPAQAPAECWRGPRPDPGLTPPRDAGAGGALAGLGALTLTAPPPSAPQALVEYWQGLPGEHRAALFRLREEDFVAELDAHLKYQLRICRDCRGNVRGPLPAPVGAAPQPGSLRTRALSL
jgi:hypothetical protein